MSEIRKGATALKGTPVDLVGPELKVGDAAPDFVLQNDALEDVSLSSLGGGTRVIATVPSLDTPVCQAETKEFNQRVQSLPDVNVLVVSTDLPFGQKRWCGSEGVQNVTTLSAHRTTKFAEDYGVLICDGPLERCLARAVFVVNPAGVLSHVEYVKEIADHPDYEAVLSAVQK